MRKHSLVWAVLLTAVLLLAVSCGSGDRADQWREFTYSVADESGLLSFKVKIKITECYYSLGEAGDVDLTVVYSAGNLGENPIRFDWSDKYVQDFNKIFHEPDSGTESRELRMGETAEELIVSYKLPANVADTGGMNKLNWGRYNEDLNSLSYHIKLAPQIRR